MAEVIDVKKEHKSVKFLKNIARSNKFLYDKEETYKIGNRNIVFKLPKPQSVDASERQSTRGLLATDHVILNHGQVTWTTSELAPSLLTTTPHQREDVSAFDRFNVIAALHDGSLVVLGSNS
ncbi:uncharacterized protein TNCV_4414311 [Trichonephila clavipes]|uniref:Uncharacterized protein n=1 Tax=Trichonephila clavipes TaxID=2585209 RepID=A0A8X6VDX5_TRICX|nr:uncharacterized protein TNCV_4414311 [Trichonephila clavipes]